jgi:peptidoglycan-associated lipoprotein
MKSSKFIHLLVIGLSLTFVAAGCKKKPAYTTTLPGQRVGTPRGGDIGSVPPIEIPSNVGVTTSSGNDIAFAHGAGHDGWPQNPSMFEAQTVYFDYDSVVVKSSEKAKIQVVAAYLQANPRNAVLIEGHCDERGTEEYNRALGERRALAVREELIMSGIAPERVDTVSYGEDRPADVGHTKEAWDKNRRGVFVLLMPPQ